MRTQGFRSLLAGVMVLLLGSTVAVLLVVGAYWGRRTVMPLVDDLAEQALARVEMRVHEHLSQAFWLSRQSLELLEGQPVTGADMPRIGDFLAKSLRAIQAPTSAGFALEETGECVFAERQPDGFIFVRAYVAETNGTRVIRAWRWRGQYREPIDDTPWDGYDPRTRPFYQAVRERRRECWTEVYSFYKGPERTSSPGVTCAAPWSDPEGRLLGVVAVDFDLQALSLFLADLAREMPGYAVIVERRADGRRWPIVHPRPASLRQPGSGQLVEKLEDIQDDVLLAYLKSLPTDTDRPAPQEFGRRFRARGEWYLGSYRQMRGTNQPPWTLGMVIPRQAVAGGVSRNVGWSLAAALACLGVGMLAALWLARLLARPVQTLSQEAQSVGQLDFDTALVPRSPVRELHQLERSIADMKASLRSFRKYVPADVVHELIRAGDEARLGGRAAELTIFFSDVTGFTSISESLPPQALVEHFGEYLAAVGDVIHAHHGTVDKFIGDGVMAFWGAPQPNPTHAADACRAAWRLTQRIDELGGTWRHAGKPPLPTRMGLHTGPVIVGNIGSSARMNYTAMGDTVNVASRIEGLNRTFRTRILVSETTRRAAGDAIVARPVGRVEVRGRNQEVHVYELLGLAGEADVQTHSLSQRTSEAFAAWERGDSPLARTLYQALLRERPEDQVLRLAASELDNARPPAIA